MSEKVALLDIEKDGLRFHSALRRKEGQTKCYLAALRDPGIQILGHPRGRIYNYRAGLFADCLRVFALAAELDKTIQMPMPTGRI